MDIRMTACRMTATFAILCMAAAMLAGCGAANRTAKLDPGYTIRPGTRFAAGNATDETGNTAGEIDITKTLPEELDKALERKGLRWEGPKDGSHISVPCKIVEYDAGNAFKRWLLPGWGTTVLTVQCDLKEKPGDRTVGSVEARRTVAAGGAYTVGAWRTIFTNVSDDVVTELGAKIGN